MILFVAKAGLFLSLRPRGICKSLLLLLQIDYGIRIIHFVKEIAMIDETTRKTFLGFQQEEADNCELYRRLALITSSVNNRDVLLHISAEEQGHYNRIKGYTEKELHYRRSHVFLYLLIARVLGLTFTVKILEQNESVTADAYRNYPEMESMAAQEELHEQKFIAMIEEEKLQYMGSVVLGLNDALVEFTGALAGYTLALGSSSLIALTGSITGIAAALSMSSSEYLSSKSEKAEGKNPGKAAIYTGIAYLFTVAVLILPFLLFSNPIIALVVMLVIAIAVIAFFNFYYSVARGESFRKRFVEMALLSFGVAGLSFIIGYLLKIFTE